MLLPVVKLFLWQEYFFPSSQNYQCNYPKLLSLPVLGATPPGSKAGCHQPCGVPPKGAVCLTVVPVPDCLRSLFRLRGQNSTEPMPSTHLAYLLLSFLYTSSHILLWQAQRRRAAAQGLQVGAGKHCKDVMKNMLWQELS